MNFLDLIKNNPVVVLNLLASVLALAVGFGLSMSEVQVGLILAAVQAVFAVVARSKVTPTNG